MNGLGDDKKRNKALQKLAQKKDDFIILVDTRLKKENLNQVHNTWTGNIHSSINDQPHSSGGILILARRGLDIIPKKSGSDRAKKGRMAWEIYELRGHRILIMGIYGPANGGTDTKNAEFYEEEVFEVLDSETYDNIVMAGDWNVFLNPKLDQKHYGNPEKYRSKTRAAIESKIRTHSLSDQGSRMMGTVGTCSQPI